LLHESGLNLTNVLESYILLAGAHVADDNVTDVYLRSQLRLCDASIFTFVQLGGVLIFGFSSFFVVIK